MRSPPASSGPSYRLASIDAYRGFVMFLMLAEVLSFCDVSKGLPDSVFWKFLCQQQSHAQWVGCNLHDLIQPSFFFLVGVALVFSVAKRRAQGQSAARLTGHAAGRAAVLVLLGIGLVSLHGFRWDFVDTLTQIGLAYGFVFVLSFRPVRDWWIVLGVILAIDWLAFVLYPLPGADFDYASVGVSVPWLAEHGLPGFAAHWQKNSNMAWAFDRWFLNLIPGQAPFTGQPNGLTTLNFVPTIGTMILGMCAGRLIRATSTPGARVAWLGFAGALGVMGGLLLGGLGVCPVVKAIWTPSWVLFSGGWCFWLLAAWYVLVDIWGQRWMAFPFVVVGMNSIAAYVISKVYPAYAYRAPMRVLGREPFLVLGEAYEPLLLGAVILLGYWLVLYGLYRGKVFVRI